MADDVVRGSVVAHEVVLVHIYKYIIQNYNSIHTTTGSLSCGCLNTVMILFIGIFNVAHATSYLQVV